MKHFDYNSTAPLHPLIINVLKNLPVGVDFNTSSLHRFGKMAQHLVSDTTEVVLKTFSLKSDEWGIYYHSGATEAINVLIKGFYAQTLKQGRSMLFCYSELDHSCVTENQRWLSERGVSCFTLPINEQGELDFSKEDFSSLDTFRQSCVFINLTRMNNELGVVWKVEDLAPLLNALKTREMNYFLHLDDVQSPGKWVGWNNLGSDVHASTYSAHKFGALKGVGMTLYRQDSIDAIDPFIVGGGQQNGLRAGTINTLGVHTIGVLFQHYLPKIDIKQTTAARLYLEQELLKNFSDHLRVNAIGARHRCSNTISLTLKNVKTESLVMAFDLEGLILSQGSACASGTSRPSRVLMSLGLDEREAKRSLRISLPHESSLEQVQAAVPIFHKVLSRFFSFN